jgi:hypothetical protein
MWNPPMALIPEEHKMAARTRQARKCFVCLRARRHELRDTPFQATVAATDSAAPGGTEPVAAGMVALATLWQAYGHVGDRDAVALTVLDQRWQMGRDGLGAEQPPLSQSPLCNLRLRLIAPTLDKTLRERTGAWAERTGGVGARQLRAALDSTPLCGAGRVADTLHLLGQAWRQAVGLAARALGTSTEAMLEEAGVGLGGHSRLKAALALDWGQPQAREQALGLVLAEVARWQKWLEQHPRLGEEVPPLQDVLDTMAPMIRQDTAPDPEGRPGGKRLKQPVAPDRRLALEDADRRHGRQSSAQTCHGFQEHLVLDLESHVTREGVVRPAHAPEPAAVARLAETLATPPGLLQLAVDLGYLASPRLTPWAEPGGSIMARPWPQGGTRLTKDACTCDCGHGQVTCPGGQTVLMVPGTDAQLPARACERCPQRAQCTTATSGQGRSRSIRAAEPCPHKLRATITTNRGRAALRKRTAVEHAISHHRAHQGRRARYKGLRQNQCDGRRHAAVSNLQVAAHSGDELQLAS